MHSYYFVQSFFNEYSLISIFEFRIGYALRQHFWIAEEKIIGAAVYVVRFSKKKLDELVKHSAGKHESVVPKKERIKNSLAFRANIIFSGIGFFADGQTIINKCRFYGCQIGHLKYIRILLAVGSASSTPWPFFVGCVSTSGATETRIPIRKKTITSIDPNFRTSILRWVQEFVSFKSFGFDFTTRTDSVDYSNVNFTKLTSFKLLIYCNYHVVAFILFTSKNFSRWRNVFISLTTWLPIWIIVRSYSSKPSDEILFLLFRCHLLEIPISDGRNDTRYALAYLYVVIQSRFLWNAVLLGKKENSAL